MVASVSLLFYVVTWLEISVAKLSVTLWYLIICLHSYIVTFLKVQPRQTLILLLLSV